MTAPNMATITASLERSLQNFSLNHETRSNGSGSSSNSGGGATRNGGGGAAAAAGRVGGEEGIIRGRSSSSFSPSSSPSNNDNNNNFPNTNSDTSLELNSHLSLPYHWEQCLDLKTGEIYYINWRNGMKAKEDPRTAGEYSGGFYSEEEEDDDGDDDGDEDDDSSYDSEESSSEYSSPSCSRERGVGYYNNNNHHHHGHGRHHHQQHRGVEKDKESVLVVAGCKSCLMYFMVPKQVEDCPKCNGQLLHFDRSESS